MIAEEPRVDASRVTELAQSLETELARLIVGQKALLRDTVIALTAGGHVLLEGVPGLGKTVLVRSLGQALSMSFARIQFTPDLMPADIVGTNIIGEDDGRREFHYQAGPIFANLVLADEINRATPKTQSALLEAMQERTVTVGTQTRPLPSPFFVLATQNPIELEGTYPLPEAQLDRFFFKILVPFPSEGDLLEIARRTTGSLPTASSAKSSSTPPRNLLANKMAAALLEPALLRRLEGLALQVRRAVSGQMGGERRSRKRGQSVEFADFRNYTPGDDFRLIDWNAYARLDRFMLR